MPNYRRARDANTWFFTVVTHGRIPILTQPNVHRILQTMLAEVRQVVRICRLRLFRLRPCLRQSLALYAVLRPMGYAVTIHFGVHKVGGLIHGHSWVTLQGKLLAERTSPAVFAVAYAYPPPLDKAASSRVKSAHSCTGGAHERK